MSPAPKYHFLSWVREGLASAIGEPEDVTSTAGPSMSRLKSTVSLNGVPVPPPDLTLIGPGDVTGFDVAQVVRMFPLPGATDAEPTMFPLIEFDRPDLPWLATPRQGAGDLLRPWLCLVAREVGVGTVERRAKVEVPVLVVPSSELPDPGATHLWAHAQLLLRDDETVAGALGPGGDPVRTVSRLICPRLLKADTSYMACVVPTFKATVAAVLGDVRIDDLHPAWEAGEAEVELPIFASWRFTTGEAGGFEELVDRLCGRQLPDGVGRRPLDVGHTAALRVDGADNVTQVESALRVPGQTTMAPTVEGHRQALAGLVAVAAAPAEDADEPVVSPPLYGSHYAQALAVDPNGAGWLDALNVDPRERVAAGLGTTVMQREQEALMERAWRQLAAHQEAERLRLRALFARFVGESLYRRHLKPLDDERAFALTAPAHARVQGANGAGASVTGVVYRSVLPNAAQALSFRRALRPRGEIAARLGHITGVAGVEPAFAGRLASLAETGLARAYTAPDGTLALAADPRSLFVGDALDRVTRVFAAHEVAEGPTGFEALSSSIAATAKLASMDAAMLSALPVPPDLATSLVVADVPELAHAKLTVTPGGLAEELVASGFALQLANGAMFAAPRDAEGRFVPVGIFDDQITVLSAPPERLVGVRLEGPRVLSEAVLDPHIAVSIVGSSFAHASVKLRTALPASVSLLSASADPLASAGIEQASVATAFHGIAAASIGELHLDEGLATGAIIDHAGVASALVSWAGEQVVSIVPAATLDKFPAFVGNTAADLAASYIGAIVGLGSIPAEDPPPRAVFSLQSEMNATRLAVEPARAVRRYLAGVLGGVDTERVFESVMWAPKFPDAMWKPLSGISKEWILAGLERLPQNTVTLAETNGRFTEAYLVGLNHELGRELVWREFPTDRRGTSFASFWGLRSAATQEPMPDIEPIAQWSAEALGEHRPASSGREDQLVLVVRGDLLRRYPGTIIFAAPDNDGHADFTATPKLPVFQGALGDEYRFIGFDLDEDQARDEKWWFVFAEQPTEPRFGLDAPEQDWGPVKTYERPDPLPGEDPEVTDATTWNNASWRNVVDFDRFRPGMHVSREAPNLAFGGVTWGAHAADVARIAFQQPVRASISALDMLPPVDPPPLDTFGDALVALDRRQRLTFRKNDA